MGTVEDTMRGRVWCERTIKVIEGEGAVAMVEKFVGCGNTEEKAVNRSDETGRTRLDEVESAKSHEPIAWNIIQNM